MPASLLYSPSDGGKEAEINETDAREATQASAEQNTPMHTSSVPNANELVRWLWGGGATRSPAHLAALAEIRSRILGNCGPSPSTSPPAAAAVLGTPYREQIMGPGPTLDFNINDM